MLSIDPRNTATKDVHAYLLAAIGPRPIALASTIDENGNPNLSPFSFFNIFSANPPIAIFSPARRVRNNTTKHTLQNAIATKEVVINVVSHDIVEQCSLSSTEYAEGVNEFSKSGLSPIASDLVAPFRVKESPVQLECKVNEVIALGQEGGAGNLVVCEIVRIHVNENVLNDQGKIDQNKIDLVGRLGANWYCRASGEALFEVEKPITTLGIGYDKIPQRVRNSYILTGNDLGKLGNIVGLPSQEEVDNFLLKSDIRAELDHCSDDEEKREMLHYKAQEFLKDNRIQEAWLTLLIDKINRT